MIFKHEFARSAKVWLTAGMKGKARRILVIVSSLPLDKDDKDFKPKKLAVLAGAAKEWVSGHADTADDYMIVGRPKTWAEAED